MKAKSLDIGLTALLATGLMSGCSSIAIRTAVEIDAPREKVYAVLADLKSYPDRNPCHRRVDGEFAEGANLTVYVQRPDGKKVTVPPYILGITENEEIIWGGGIRGIFYGEHRFILESKNQNRTLLRHEEDFSGLAVGFADLPANVLADGYHQVNLALKTLLEKAQ